MQWVVRRQVTWPKVGQELWLRPAVLWLQVRKVEWLVGGWGGGVTWALAKGMVEIGIKSGSARDSCGGRVAVGCVQLAWFTCIVLVSPSFS